MIDPIRSEQHKGLQALAWEGSVLCLNKGGSSDPGPLGISKGVFIHVQPMVN